MALWHYGTMAIKLSKHPNYYYHQSGLTVPLTVCITGCFSLLTLLLRIVGLPFTLSTLLC